MEKYIEVLGESEYEEIPKKIVVDLDITLRASKEDVAQKESKEIVNKALDQLFAKGLTKSEVNFGGRETFTPWWKRNKAGIETQNRITIKSDNFPLVYMALDSIDRYKDNKRIIFRVSERQPVFEPDQSQIDKALEAVIDSARNKAEILAHAANGKVGEVLEIEETKRGVRGSGSYGDYDWGDNLGITIASAAAVGAGAAEDEEPAARIEGNARTVFVKYRVKFKLV
ncbi:MAG: SIMPL domain-containing protein [Candidatus Thiodiazotropha sp.]|jgi:hypothetical protein